jgi:Kef-type K+ transport system membrane component KefB
LGQTEISRPDAFAAVLLASAMVVFAGIVGRWSAGRLRQPPVLGELTIGILAGNIG